jgi:hypothetical protein
MKITATEFKPQSTSELKMDAVAFKPVMNSNATAFFPQGTSNASSFNSIYP